MTNPVLCTLRGKFSLIFMLLSVLAGCGPEKPSPSSSSAPATAAQTIITSSPVSRPPVTLPAAEGLPAPLDPEPGNQAPVINDIAALEARAGETFYLMPGSLDADGDLLTFRAQGLPNWASFNPDTGAISGIPGSDSVGLYRGVTITVSDGMAADTTAPFSIRVTGIVKKVPAHSTSVKQAGTPAPRTIATDTTVAAITADTPLVRKYHPGHYIAMNKFDDHLAIMNAVKPGVVGMQIRYSWATLEPGFGNYDFSRIKADLAVLTAQGMQLVIFLEDKSFSAEIPTPPYLRDYTLANRHGGYTAMRWSPYVIERLNLLLQALGAAFDSHPNVEGVALQESALGIEDGALAGNHYTPEKYRDALLSNLRNAAGHFPGSQIFWYMNFLQGNQGYLRSIATAAAPLGVALGGPDVLPDDHSLQTHAYPMYDEFKGHMTLFNSIQFNSYGHKHATGGYPTKYWTMGELFRFARDRLHVDYLFWNRKSWKDPQDSYTWLQALPIISSNPSFNRHGKHPGIRPRN